MPDFLGSQRLEYILNKLKQHHAVRTKFLAAELNVADETIRTDLILLEERGLIKRVHGGAISIRQHSCQEERQSTPSRFVTLANLATSFIKKGECVFLDGGKIGHTIATHLTDQELGIVTNSLEVANALHEKNEITIYLSGGALDKDSGILLGQSAAQSIEMIGIHTMVLCPDIIDPEYGAGYYSRERAEFIKTLLKPETKLILVSTVDNIKSSLAFYPAKIDHIKTIITNENLSDSHIERFQSHHIEIVSPSR